MFYLTHPRGEPQRMHYVAWQKDQESHLYVYVPNTGKFHLNHSLTTDFYFDQEQMTFIPIDPDRAAAEVAAGTGRIDRRKSGFIIDEYEADPDPVDPVQILPTVQ